MTKFDRVYVPHPNFRFPTAPLLEIAEEIVYVCDTPIFDDFLGDEHKYKFEGIAAKKLKDFDPEKDVIAFYGDPIIFTMMVTYVLNISETVKVARYSSKFDRYLVREINADEDWTGYKKPEGDLK